MASPKPILEYSLDRPQPRTLTLESTKSTVRVIFSVAPKWCYWLPIVGETAFGFVHFISALTIAAMMYHLFHLNNIPTTDPDTVRSYHRWMLEILASGCISPTFWWIIAAYSLWKYRRWGRVPRILTATSEGLTYSKLGFRSIRHRTWPTNQIKQIRFRSIRRNLNPKRTAADLYIYSHKKLWPKHFRLSSPNPELPALIAKELAAILGHP